MTIKNMICPVCNNSKNTHLFSQIDKRTNMPGTFIVYKCSYCKTEFIKPPKNLSEYYKSDYYFDFNKNNLLFKIKQKVIQKKYNPHNIFEKILYSIAGNFISALPSRTGKTLDFGCSGGDIIYMLKNAGFNTYGMDISKDAVQRCKKHNLKNVKVGTETDLVIYPDDFFDSIRASHVIEHMTDPGRFIKLASKKLTDDGELVIQTPNINSFGRLFGRYAKYYFDIPRHTILFSSNSLEYLLKKNGFHKIEISYINFFGDQADNALLFFKEKLQSLYKFFSNKWINIIFRLLFLPLELLLTILKKGQTITVRSIKKSET